METRNQVLATGGTGNRGKVPLKSEEKTRTPRERERPLGPSGPDSLGILLILTVFRAAAATLPRNLSRPRKVCLAAVNNRQILGRLNRSPRPPCTPPVFRVPHPARTFPATDTRQILRRSILQKWFPPAGHDSRSNFFSPTPRPYLASKFVERKFERPRSERERRVRSVGKSARAARITPGHPHPRRQTSASFDTLIHIKQQSIPGPTEREKSLISCTERVEKISSHYCSWLYESSKMRLIMAHVEKRFNL